MTLSGTSADAGLWGHPIFTVEETPKFLLEEGILTHDPRQVKEALDSGVNPNDANGIESFMHMAARFSHAYTVRLLIEGGGFFDRPNRLGNVPLHLAAAAGKADIVRELLMQGANPIAVNFYQATPLDAAIFARKEECCAILADSVRDLTPYLEKARRRSFTIATLFQEKMEQRKSLDLPCR